MKKQEMFSPELFYQFTFKKLVPISKEMSGDANKTNAMHRDIFRLQLANNRQLFYSKIYLHGKKNLLRVQR